MSQPTISSGGNVSFESLESASITTGQIVSSAPSYFDGGIAVATVDITGDAQVGGILQVQGELIAPNFTVDNLTVTNAPTFSAGFNTPAGSTSTIGGVLDVETVNAQGITTTTLGATGVVAGALEVSGAITALGTLSVTGQSTLGDVTATTIFADSIETPGGIATTGPLSASSLTTDGALTVGGLATLADVQAATLDAGSINSDGDITATGAISGASVSATNISSTGTLEVLGQTTLGGAFTASGASTFSGAATFTDAVTVDGAAGITTTTLSASTSLETAGDLFVDGTAIISTLEADSISSTGALNVATDLTVEGTASVAAFDADTVTTSGNVDVGGDLIVDGTTDLTGLLTTVGLVATGSADLNGITTVNGAITAGAAATFNGPLTANDTATFNSTVSVPNGFTSLFSNGTVTGTAFISTDDAVTSTFGPVTVDSIAAIGPSTFGTLTVDDLTVTTTATFPAGLSASGASISNVGNPVAATDAVNLQTLNAAVSGVAPPVSSFAARYTGTTLASNATIGQWTTTGAPGLHNAAGANFDEASGTYTMPVDGYLDVAGAIGRRGITLAVLTTPPALELQANGVVVQSQPLSGVALSALGAVIGLGPGAATVGAEGLFFPAGTEISLYYNTGVGVSVDIADIVDTDFVFSARLVAASVV
ncbi:hypothetical protein [Mollivirus kamchatka]|nr:hypothetical protein [Mollivirus kamchatka]